MNKTPHIALLPSPGMGHLIPLIEFAKQLVRRHDFTVTIIVPISSPPSETITAVLNSLRGNISHIFLPPVNLSDQPADINIEVQIFLTITRSLPSLRETLKLLILRTNLVALIADGFSTDAFEIARELQISPYLFFTANALTLSFCFHLPELDLMVSGEFRDLPEPVKIPGCVAVQGRDLLDPVQDRSGDAYRGILCSVKRFKLADGILVNSFMELEKGAFNAFKESEISGPPVYPIGPLIQSGLSNDGDQFECLNWLDKQPSGSVLFVAFGSGGTLSHRQLKELAMGLEMSGQKFLWVVRAPNDDASNGAYFNTQMQKDPLGFLSEGFLDRTRGQGLVVPNWAPQAQVLAHDSTGGFVTHCGWNSTLESIVHGVPLIAWPLYAEQKMTAVMLTDDLKVALRPQADENGLVGREEIEKVVKCLLEGEGGEKVRYKMKILRDASVKVVRKSAAHQEVGSMMTWPRVARGSPFAVSRFARVPFSRGGIPSIYRPRIPIKTGARSMQWKRDTPSEGSNSVPSPTARSLTYVRMDPKTNGN
ncbi:hypothetical protein LguiA_019448 [Lonicera macranthoides]